MLGFIRWNLMVFPTNNQTNLEINWANLGFLWKFKITEVKLLHIQRTKRNAFIFPKVENVVLNTN